MSIHLPRNLWRFIVPVLLLVAIFGPWWFDQISVPAQYPCNPPIRRLEGDFCGVPMPGTYVYFLFGAWIFELIAAPETTFLTRMGALEATWQIGKILLALVFLILPFVSTSLLIFKGERKSLQWLQIVALGGSAGIVLAIGILSYPLQVSWDLWGLWLFIGVALAALVVEALRLALSNRSKTT